MQYVGSKNRLSKELAPIIQSYITEDTEAYIEPFVGGANMIDKIKHHTKIGSDVHKELIALHNFNKKNVNHIPDTFTKEEWNDVKNNRTRYPDWYVGLIGFCSFGSVYFSSYPQSKKCSDVPAQMIRSIKRQSPNIQDVIFEHKSFLDYNPEEYKNCVFYLDPPYRNTFSYKNGKFPYEAFDKWAIELAKNNTVLISEYEMPEDNFECIWSKDVKVTLNAKVSVVNKKRVEKLFKVRGGK